MWCVCVQGFGVKQTAEQRKFSNEDTQRFRSPAFVEYGVQQSKTFLAGQHTINSFCGTPALRF